jgi:hypothetical protein
MPDLRAMSGKPLPVPDLAPGTVSVRVARKLPMNAAADLDVTATIASGGKEEARTVKTGADGRATFTGLPVGATFQATVTVDGERLETARFPVAAQGGTRTMLIAGLGPAGAETTPAGGVPAPAGPAPAEGAPSEPFRMGVVAGKVEPGPGIPAGSLEIEVRDDAGKGLAGLAVKLGQVRGEKVDVLNGITDPAGAVRWSGLVTGPDAAYAAVVEHQGMRLSSEPFRMEADTGMRGTIRAIARTSDPSALRLDERSMIVIEAREEAVVLMQRFVFKNVSEKLFDPGESGLLIPLPAGFKSAQEVQGGAEILVRPAEGVALKAPIPPNSAAVYAVQAQYGFVLPSDGEAELQIRQPMPFGLESPFIVVPEASKLTLRAAGLKRIEDKTDGSGNTVHRYELPAIGVGGTLAITVVGLPARDRSGQRVVAALTFVLVLLAVVGLGGKKVGPSANERTNELTARREKLFAELVQVEQARRAAGEKSDAALDRRRKELVTKLEEVYKALAA